MKRRDFLLHSIISSSLLAFGLPKKVYASPIVIDSFPYEIDSPGTYVLDQSHQISIGEYSAITVQSDFVTIDFQGYTLENTFGDATRAVGVYVSKDAEGKTSRSVVIENGSLVGFHTGIYTRGSKTIPTGYQLSNLTLDNYACGIYLHGSGNKVSNCSITANIRSSVVEIDSCTGSIGLVIRSSNGTLVEHCDFDLKNTGDGDGTICVYVPHTGTDCIIKDCTLMNADGGVVIHNYNHVNFSRDNTYTNVRIPQAFGVSLGGDQVT